MSLESSEDFGSGSVVKENVLVESEEEERTLISKTRSEYKGSLTNPPVTVMVASLARAKAETPGGLVP